MKIDATATQPTVAPLRRESWNWGKSVGITKGFPWTDIGVFLNFQLVNITESWTKKKIYEPFYGSSYLLIKKKKTQTFLTWS